MKISEKFKGVDNIGVSVVIITLNGADRILPTLKHLSAQQKIEFNWEVIIVDNNSTDKTESISRYFWDSDVMPCELRIINEPKPGQANARKTGMLQSKYRYMLYCDDDNWLVSDYVSNAFRLISKDTNIAAIGGKGILEFEKGFKVPTWMDESNFSLGSGPQGKKDGDTSKDKGCLYTAGAIFDREWLSKLYESGFQTVLKGRDGKSLVGGEDTELTYALSLLGGKLHYYSQLEFTHFMPVNRINWKYLTNLSRGMGKSNYILQPYTTGKHNSMIKDYLITSLLLVKYFFKVAYNGFSKGDENVIICYRFLGKLEAIKYGQKTQAVIFDNLKRLKPNNSYLMKK